MLVDPAATSMMTIAVGSILWIVMMIIVLNNKFKNPKHKKIWIIAMILCPPSALLFPFIGMKQLK